MRRRKNKGSKNKKNKQNKMADENANATVDNGSKPHNDGGQVPEFQNSALQQDAAVDLDAHHRQQETNLVEAEKRHWLQREASLEDTINQLRNINDSCLQERATFEGSIKLVENENDSHKQKRAGLEKEFKQLLSESDFWFQKEVLDKKVLLGLKVIVNFLCDSIKRNASQVVQMDEKDPVLLSDAPLIGASLRLISFFAKYVSGSDLVQESP